MNASERRYKVLLADDDPFIIALYRDKLAGAGCLVETVGDGEEALRRIQAAPPDLLLLDLNMPRIDGVDVLRYVREKSAAGNLPVIVLSGACARERIETVNRLRPTRLLFKWESPPHRVVDEIRAVLEEAARNGRAEALPAVPPPEAGSVTETIPGLLDALESAGEPGARRDILLRIYRLAQDDLRALRAENPLSAEFQFGSALEQYFEEIYVRPENLNLSRCQVLRHVLPAVAICRGHAGGGGAAGEKILARSDDAGLRRRVFEWCDRPGLMPLLVCREDTAVEFIAENALRAVIWQAARPSAARKVLRRIRAIEKRHNLWIVFLLPAGGASEALEENLDPRAVFIDEPVDAPAELLTVLFALRSAGNPAGTA